YVTDGSKPAGALSLAVWRNDLYVAGYEDFAFGTRLAAKYWKNGEMVSLTDGAKEAIASSIFLSR
ncbi:MAG: hypothetical protein ACJ749_05990, partial [Flavisolibacter sp.]